MTRNVTLSVLLFAHLFCGALSRVHAAPSLSNGWTLFWKDEFQGDSLDHSKWIHWLPGSRRDAVNTPQAVSVSGGVATITTYTVGSTHYTGMISTNTKLTTAYGYLEARINYNDSPGMWSAFWMQSPSMGNPIGDPQTAGTEIDICEHRVQDGSGANIDGKIVGNIHWDGYGASHRSTGYDSGNLSLGGGYHVYGLEWTPTVQRFYIDGVLRWTVNDGANSPVSQRGEFVILSSEVDDTSTTWAGPIPAGGYGSVATSTTKMQVDYVRFYKPAETVLNADFEGRLDPFGSSSSSQAAWSATGGRTTGVSAGRLAPTAAAGASLLQTVRGLLPATDYVLTGWGNAGTTSPSLFIGVKDHGQTQVGQTLTSSGYSKISVPFTTGDSNRTAAVVASSASVGSTGYVDDFLLRRAATVNNGQFESGTAGPWNSLYGGAVIDDDGTNYGGVYAVKIPASSSSAGIEPEIVGLTPATAYRYTGWTRNGGQNLTFGVKNHGSSQVSSTVSASAWTRGTVNFTTGATNTSASVFAFRGSSTATTYADSFFLYEPLAAPWTSQDVTSIPLAGVSGRLGDKFVVQAAGADIWGTSDKFHFINTSISGDTQVTARILGLEPTNPGAKTGVMIRESAASGSRSAMVNWTPAGTVEFIRRTATGGSSVATVVNNVATPPWVRLARRGNSFSAAYSVDGTAWQPVGSPVTIAMATAALGGVPTCSHDDALLTEAVLDNVTLAPPPPEILITSPANHFTLQNASLRLRVTATIPYSGGLGAPVIAWTKVSGPGTVTFENAAIADTSVVFSAVGNYVLRCAATTTAGPGTAEIAVNVGLSTTLLREGVNGYVHVGALLREDSKSLNSGERDQFLVGKLSSGDRARNVFSFDLSSIPASATIQSAALHFWTASAAGVGSVGPLELRLLDATPIEGSDDGSGTGVGTGATWNSRDGGSQLWTAAGGDFGASALSTMPGFSASGLNQQKTFQSSVSFQSAAQTAVTSSVPLDVMLLSSATESGASNNYVRLHSDDATTASQRPQLALVWTANAAPVVNAGLVPSAMNGIAATLTGSSSNATSTAWSKVSGPGLAVFANPASAATTVTVDQAGTYVLRLTASNTHGQVSNDLTAVVGLNPSVFSDWQSIHWPGNTIQSTVGPGADPDKDGSINLMEWATGADPNAYTPATGTVLKSGSMLEFTYTKRKSISGANYSVEWSADLTSWNTSGITTSVLVDGALTQQIKAVVPAGVGKRYVRLKVTQ